MATHSRILSRKISWTEELGGPLSTLTFTPHYAWLCSDLGTPTRQGERSTTLGLRGQHRGLAPIKGGPQFLA